MMRNSRPREQVCRICAPLESGMRIHRGHRVFGMLRDAPGRVKGACRDGCMHPAPRQTDYRFHRTTLNTTNAMMIITAACLTPARSEASPIAPAIRPEKNAWMMHAW